ncbi:hypothetical protein C5C56_11230 [Rathayibacter sp. AY1D1]|uniref:hypothetical protein n=1 Tax=Rathayibacter sp. AY1D1 TaxID=2080542 RepID=UPI000CE761F8|nr:hypothetical protein [Rathayibacter sp. AY1D1]PPH98176.1 hypothetical protein C5C56_11230 [Rathayibacter sp. AY1D1]
MSEVLSEADLAAVHELINSSQLDRVDFHELSARRVADTNTENRTADDDGNLNLGVQQRIDETSFGVRLNASVSFTAGEATVSVAAEYSLKSDYKPSKRTLQIFCNEVAIMTVFPYLREGMSSITTRVFGEAIYLPVAERGTISVDVDPT